MISATELILH